MYRRKRAHPHWCAFAAPPIACAGARGASVVKVCGVANAEDANAIGRIAKLELPSYVDMYLGMIVWPNSKRSVNHSTARDISRAARRHGMRPVAVFVDEPTETIVRTCAEIEVDVAQLHGPKTRSAVLRQPLPNTLHMIDVVDVGAGVEKRVENSLFTLCDTPGGGTGHKFDWNNFQPPAVPWLLAGGLNPENVAEAIRTLRPTGVDVSSGVTCADRVKKDVDKVTRFFREFVLASAVTL